jgi:dTDP-4-dehydrorhamnose reductase
MRVVVTGAGGQVGRELVALLQAKQAQRRRGPALEVLAATRQQLDVADRDAVLAAVGGAEPDLVVHLAAWTAVDACEGDPDRALAVNSLGTRHVAEAARRAGAHLCYVSTDYVFDGRSPRPYVEWDTPCPLSVYGRSKLGGESECDPAATIVRTSWVCGRHGANMVKTVLRLAQGDGPLRFVDDQRGSPTEARDLAGAILRLAIERLPGIHHVTNQGVASWYELAAAVVSWSGGDAARVEPIPTGALVPPRPAPRPANSVLDNAALRLAGLPLLPDWREPFEALVRDLVST